MKKLFNTFDKIDFSSSLGRRQVFQCLQAFANKTFLGTDNAAMRKQIQAFGNAGDFPDTVLQILQKFQATPQYDSGYEEIFDVRDFTASKKSGFDILDVEDGLSFSEVSVGEKAHIYKMGGTKATVDFVRYGGGLGWDRGLIDDEEYWTLENNAVAFVNKAAHDKAAAHYALIEALAAGYNVTWQNPEPSGLAATDALYTANCDAQTLNHAALDIFNGIKDKGYGVTPQNAVFTIVSPLEIVPRLNRALALMLQGFAGSASQVGYKFRLIPTAMFGTVTSYYVCIPKIKAMSGTRQNLTIFNQFDIEAYADVAVGWQRFGGAIGDSEQFRRCAIS
jgi:hypothetical protein